MPTISTSALVLPRDAEPAAATALQAFVGINESIVDATDIGKGCVVQALLRGSRMTLYPKMKHRRGGPALDPPAPICA